MIALLGAETSYLRRELCEMAFDALAAEPAERLQSDPELVALLLSALTAQNTERVATLHALPAMARIGARIEAATERVRDVMPESAEADLLALIELGKGPRFGWLKGAIDPSDLRELFAPVLQQLLVQFSTKLPIPGMGAQGQGGSAGALGGLVGRLGKQVQKSASQLADVGKSVMGGLSGELERRMQTLARDFSHTAVGELQKVTAERLTSPEGKAILARMRARALAHLMDARLSDIAHDLLRLPTAEIAQLSPGVVSHNRERKLLSDLLEAELAAALETVGKRSLSELLAEYGLLASAREMTLRVVDPSVRALVQSERFGAFLERLVSEAKAP